MNEYSVFVNGGVGVIGVFLAYKIFNSFVDVIKAHSTALVDSMKAHDERMVKALDGIFQAIRDAAAKNKRG
jgi:hypothetical protein